MRRGGPFLFSNQLTERDFEARVGLFRRLACTATGKPEAKRGISFRNPFGDE